MLRKTLFTLLLLSFALLARSDLPVHCLKHQVVGTWNVQRTQLQLPASGEYFTCGHQQPDTQDTSNEDGSEDFKPDSSFQFVLNADATAYKIDSNGKTSGNWTMIYDEGLDLVFNGERYTNFFYYFRKGLMDYGSNCGKTTIGWYTNKNGSKACWKAIKELEEDIDPESLLGEQTEQKFFVQPEELRSDAVKDSAGLDLQASSSKNKKRDRVREEEPRKAKYNRDFKDHQEIVDRINSDGKKTWKAKAHEKFESKSLGELNKMAGRNSKKNRGISLIQQAKTSEDVSDLPKEWTWEPYLSPMKEQGGCGSCYLVATTEMLEARLRIFHNESAYLSIQHPLDCSYYNQGCDGGYPYLAGLFAQEYGLVPEDCEPYKSKVGVCGTMCDVSKLPKTYGVSDSRFVGGYFGNCSERAMMEELMNKGPFVANFEPSSMFMYYSGGVFKNEGGEPEWLEKGEPKPEWEKVDHSVLLFGWGETDDGQKYWILRNSWGNDWGENGNFRIQRGVDDSAIESYGEASDPYVIHHDSN